MTSLLFVCAGLAACATQGGAASAEPDTAAGDASADAAKGDATTTAKAAPAAPYVYETWPPPDAAAPVARPAPSGEMVELPSHPQGVGVLDLLTFVSQQTGVVFLYDEPTNPKIRTARVQYVGAWRVPRSRVLDTVRAALATNNLVLVPVGTPEQHSGAWAVLDQNNAAVKSKPVYVPENELLGCADCDGLYVVTSLRVRDTVDISRVRQALTALTSVVAGGGRIQDVPGARTIVVADLAPVAAAMKRLVDEMNRIAVAPPPPSAAPAPPK